MSSSNCCFLTCIQISQEAGQVVCYSHLFQNFPQFIVIHTVKGFDIVNNCFPQSCGIPIIKSHRPSSSDSLRIPSPFVESPGWEAWHVVQNLHNSGRTSLILLFSSLCVTYLTGMGFDFIMVTLLLQSRCGFFFVFGRGISFIGGFQCPPVDGCSTVSCNFGALEGRDEHTSFYSSLLN